MFETEKKVSTVHIPMTDEEKAFLKAEAKKANLTMTGLIKKALNKYFTERNAEEK